MNYLCTLLVVLVIGLSGCATPNVSSSYSLEPTSKNGIAVVSVTYQGSYSGYGVLYRELSGKTSGLFQAGEGNMLIPVPEKSDFGLPVRGKLVVVELPPGEYEIFRWRVSSGLATVVPQNDFSIRFSVESGKAVYVGNFNFVQTARMGLTVTGAKVAFGGTPDRDLTRLKELYPKLAEIPVALSTPPETLLADLGGAQGVRFAIPLIIRR